MSRIKEEFEERPATVFLVLKSEKTVRSKSYDVVKIYGEQEYRVEVAKGITEILKELLGVECVWYTKGDRFTTAVMALRDYPTLVELDQIESYARSILENHREATY